MAVVRIPFKSDDHNSAHSVILEKIRRRYKMSYDEMSRTRYAEFKNNEERFIAYMPEREPDRLKRLQREEGKPQYTTLKIPWTYAKILTAHSYMTSVFLAREPIIQFEGRHGETEDQVLAVEAIHSYQMQVGLNMVPLYLWLLDGGKYGVGFLGVHWENEVITSSTITEQQTEILGIPMGPKRLVRTTRTADGYVGNKLFNIRPQNAFPDPRVPLWRLQQGEFFGRIVDVSWNDIRRGEEAGRYFNVDEIKKQGRQSNFDLWQKDEGSAQIETPDNVNRNANLTLGDGSNRPGDMDFVSLLEMHVELAPKDWGLGGSIAPEMWVFTVANAGVIVSAQPAGWLHGKFPFFTWEPELDGYSFINRGKPEVIDSIQRTIDWLLNTHYYNVRKTMNNEFIVDPSMVEMVDVLDPKPGKLIRLKPEAYGRDASKAIHQFEVQDVTRNNLADMEIMNALGQRVDGVTDNLMGLIEQKGRRTATEARQSNVFAVNRLKTEAELASMQSWTPMAQVLLQQTQQRFTKERAFRVAGRLAIGANQYVDVAPEAIQGQFDFVPIDGTMPIDRFALANTWRELMSQAASVPEIRSQYDFGKIFAYAARLAGAKNIEQFKVEVIGDEQAQIEADRGNIVPLTGGQDGSSGNAGGGASASTAKVESVSQPSQIRGMGQTG